MSLEIEPVTTPKMLGEGPHWDPKSGNLYFVDSFGASIHRYNPKEDKEYTCKISDGHVHTSIIIPIKNTTNKFLVTIDRDLNIVTWDGVTEKPEKIDKIATLDEMPGNEANMINDGKVDPTGRLWVGTMGPITMEGVWSPEKGSLYSLFKGEVPKRHLGKLSISNGLAWNANLTKMFYIDSPTRRIDVFDYEPDSGTIRNRRLFFDVSPLILKSKDGGPDGMTIDSEDNLWFAVFGEGIVVNVNGATGDLIRKIDVPSPQPTSVAFGGENLEDLYVTTANFSLSEDLAREYPKAGSVFRIRGLGVRGREAMPADFH